MSPTLYFDTARFGSILPECAAMLREFAVLLETEGQIPLFDAFLREGGHAWPEELLDRYPMLARWQGLDGLRRNILRLCGISNPATLLFSGSSRQLARIAYRSLLQRCERILCSDLDWPEFQDMLRQQSVHFGGVVHKANVRTPFEHHGVQEHHVERLRQTCVRHGCNGASLTPISNDGVATPVTSFMDSESGGSLPRFLVVDGAQQIGHVPVELGESFQGIYLAGTHKWLCSGVPLSFAVFVHDADHVDEQAQIRKAIRSSFVDDTLLLQTADVGLKPPRQTMRIEPLLAAGLAVEHALQQDIRQQLSDRCDNSRQICELFSQIPTPLYASWRHGMIILESQGVSATLIQEKLARHGLTLSVLDDRHLRISCPAEPLTPAQVGTIEDALVSLMPLAIPELVSQSGQTDDDHSLA